MTNASQIRQAQVWSRLARVSDLTGDGPFALAADGAAVPALPV